MTGIMTQALATFFLTVFLWEDCLSPQGNPTVLKVWLPVHCPQHPTIVQLDRGGAMPESKSRGPSSTAGGADAKAALHLWGHSIFESKGLGDQAKGLSYLCDHSFIYILIDTLP